MSLRDQIFATDDLETKEVMVPEWEAKVIVKALTAAQREAWERTAKETRAKGTVRASAIVMVCYDEAGNLIFTPEDIDRLNAKSSAAVSRLFNIFVDMNIVTEDDVDEMEGN